MTTAFQIGSMLIPECRVQLKGVYDHIAGSLASISAQTDIRLYRTVGIGLSYSVNDLDWKTGSAGVVLTVGLGGISTSIFGTRSGEATGYAALGTMQGGAQISSAGLDFTQTTSGGQPQLIVQAFRDDNDNGLRDGGEIELDAPAVTVRQGNNVIQGRNRLFLSPYRESHIEVDPGSYLSQGLYPSRANFDIYTQQGTVEVITVPFSVGIDVTGSCEVHPAAGNPRRITTSAINGLRVTLESVDGSAKYDGEIFSDGTLLVSGVRQGRYSIALDPEQLAERDLTAESVPEEITIDLERQTVPTLLLIPATH
jgi:hypothetical protein